MLRRESVREFAELVIPELRRRGRLPERAAHGTMREQLLGAGPHPAARHPAALTEQRDAVNHTNPVGFVRLAHGKAPSMTRGLMDEQSYEAERAEQLGQRLQQELGILVAACCRRRRPACRC